jgi:hypothetical protein
MLEDPLAPKRRRWTSWLLAYSAFVTAFVGAVPQYWTWLSAFRHDVPASEWQIAQENARLWSTNLACASQPPGSMLERDGVRVTATVCPNADVLIGVTKGGRSSLRWIGHDTLRRGSAARQVRGVALADERPAATQPPASAAPTVEQVLCQKRESPRRVLRRIQRADGTCRDETVNVYTGRVSERGDAPCDDRCEGGQSP